MRSAEKWSEPGKREWWRKDQFSLEVSARKISLENCNKRLFFVDKFIAISIKLPSGFGEISLFSIGSFKVFLICHHAVRPPQTFNQRLRLLSPFKKV